MPYSKVFACDYISCRNVSQMRPRPPRGNQMDLLARRIVRDAKLKMEKKSAALTAEMAPKLGGFVYGNGSISHWIKGDDRISGEALLALAAVSGLSLDAYLGEKPAGEEAAELREEMRKLQRRMDRLEGSDPGDARDDQLDA